MAILADLFLNRKHNSIRQYDIKGILPIFLAFFRDYRGHIFVLYNIGRQSGFSDLMILLFGGGAGALA